MSAETPKRRGRPPLPPGEKKGSNLTIRTRPRTRAFLEAMADKTSRTITEEAEYRIEKSTEVDTYIFGDVDTFRLLVGFAQTIRSIERAVGTRWFDDPSGIVKLRMKQALGGAIDFEITMRKPVTEVETVTAARDDVGVMPAGWLEDLDK